MRTGQFKTLFLGLAAVAACLSLGAGAALGAHPDVPLYTFEEVGMQFTSNFDPTTAPMAEPGDDFNMMPVMVDSNGAGFPYSPKMTCGNCHNGSTNRWDNGQTITDASGNPISQPLVSYNAMTTQAFHAELGAQEWQDIDDTQTTQPGKPWSETSGMFGKW